MWCAIISHVVISHTTVVGRTLCHMIQYVRHACHMTQVSKLLMQLLELFVLTRFVLRERIVAKQIPPGLHTYTYPNLNTLVC